MVGIGSQVVTANEGVIHPGECINIMHHFVRMMQHGEEVPQKLFSPMLDLVDGSIIIMNSLRAMQSVIQ